MEQITLGDFAAFLAFLAGLGGSIATIVHFIKKALSGLFKEQTEEINKRLDKQEKAIQKVDCERAKDFLVSYLSKLESGGTTDEIETQRFWEVFQHYTDHGGNSYIKQKVEKLKTAGKL